MTFCNISAFYTTWSLKHLNKGNNMNTFRWCDPSWMPIGNLQFTWLTAMTTDEATKRISLKEAIAFRAKKGEVMWVPMCEDCQRKFPTYL